MDAQQELFSVSNLQVRVAVKQKGTFGSRFVEVPIVDGVNFTIHKGETLGLVGESGCGKTTLGRALVRIGRTVVSGTIRFEGRDISALSNKEFRPLRKEMQLMFQDPFASLNPRLMIEQMLLEVMKVHHIADGDEARKRVRELLEVVGLNREFLYRFPHELSGGQRQRIGIARALAVNPKFIVCDEPVSALDVSIQSQIINLLKDLQRSMGIAYLFIAHDLSVVEYISHRVAVMYLGRIVELAEATELYKNPLHPYTRALLSAIPSTEVGAKKERILLSGDLPSITTVPQGCVFHPRCPQAKAECRHHIPQLQEHSSGHQVACLLYE
uniref:Oligopeptide/dipeptide ABC transporter, ATP-binding protein-like protein n=1 Tax=Chlorobium chlorochromatii (strain CaD3) TaxID=340177 RepID=Q3APW9_CHLCH